MNIVAIIQARMSSTRLPGKVLLPLVGKPVLEHVLDRLGYCQTINSVVVATSNDTTDEAIEQWCLTNGIACFRGSLHDVLDRYYQCATQHHADAIVRITADCPAIDPVLVDEVVRNFIEGGYEHYCLSGEFPDGLDCTVFSIAALSRAWKEATLASDREHVGPYVERQPTLFKSGKLTKFSGLSHHRWTLDESRDFKFLQAIFEKLYREDSPFLAQDVLALLDREPHLIQLNNNIIRNEGYIKSLAVERENLVQP